MNDIIFVRGRGGLGRALQGEDHICGIVALMAAAQIPAQLQGADQYQTIYSVQDAEDLGIEYTESQTSLEMDALKYQIESIYAVNEKAVVHLFVGDSDGTGNLASDLITLQNKAEGKIRQAIVLDPSTDFVPSLLTTIQASCDVLEAEHKPLSVIYAANFVGVTIDDDLRALDNKNVSVVIGQDGNGKGSDLATSYSHSFPCAGACVGVLSGSKVSENIAWVGQFNINKNLTNEFDVIKFADGRLYSDLSKSEVDALNDLGYIFLIKHIGKAGSYFNDSHTATSETSDFAYIENVRTIDKAVRGVREFLLPKLNSPLFVNGDGTLTEDTIAGFKNDSERPLEDMETNGELSIFQVLISPEQDVLSSSKITITIVLVPVGVARNIKVNIGFAVKLQSAN